MLIKGRSIHTGWLADGKWLPPDTLEGGWYPTGDIVRLEKKRPDVCGGALQGRYY